MSGEKVRVALAAAVAMGAVFSALGCGSATEPSDVGTVVSLTNADHGRTIAVLVADAIELTLQTIGPGAYGTPVLSSPSIRFVGEFSPGPPNPGGVRQGFRFEAISPGRAEITIPHMDGFPLPRDPFVIIVEVH